MPVNASPAVNPSLPTVSITSRYAPRLACAEANIFCCRLSTLFWSSTMRDRRAVAPAIWSDVPIRLRTPDAAARVATTPLTLLNILSNDALPACTARLYPRWAFSASLLLRSICSMVLFADSSSTRASAIAETSIADPLAARISSKLRRQVSRAAVTLRSTALMPSFSRSWDCMVAIALRLLSGYNKTALHAWRTVSVLNFRVSKPCALPRFAFVCR